jgi:Family of unknown function (DUF5763)
VRKLNVNKKYLIYSGALVLGVAFISILLKNNISIRDEGNPGKPEDKKQCKALTSSGKRCKRQPLPRNEFCWQHQN